MLKFGSRWVTARPLMVGYGVAIVSVGAAVIGLALLQVQWHADTQVSILLMAVIVAARFGGTKPGLLAAGLAVLGLNYLLTGASLTGSPAQAFRLAALAVVACYVVWLTTTERARSKSLQCAHDELQRGNDALRTENLERRHTEEELRASEAKFRALAQGAPAAIFISQDDRISYCNPAASAITGYDCGELEGKSFWDIVARDKHAARIRAAAGQQEESTPRRLELEILTKAGEMRWLDVTEAVFEFAANPATVRLAFDITERKQAEEALRDSQQLLVQVLATLPVGVSVTNRAGDITMFNAALRRLWGEWPTSGFERRAKVVGWWHDSGRRITPSEWASARALFKGQTSLNELVDVETFLGERKTLQTSAAPIRNAEGEIMGAVIVNEDVTERVRTEEALQESAARLQQLSHRLLVVQEEERRHLSRELHDEFGQLLASVTLHLQAAKSSAGQAAQPSLDESIALLQRAGAQVRSLALELRPMLLETAGLDATLRWLAEQHQQRTGIITQVVGHAGDVSSEVANACFRVAQEALTNVVRHAAARHVWIELSQGEGLLKLVVRDDGMGFDVQRTLEQSAGGGHLGLLGMRERMQILGGHLGIDSRPGDGTYIRVSLPQTA
jgi:PAS domain S-box-containing protein